MARTLHARKRKPMHPAELKLQRIREILERMARGDGDEPGKTGIPEADRIYKLAGGKVAR